MSNVHQGIAALNPYQPGKPIDELTRELGISDIVKLASNENPRGPGPGVFEAIERECRTLSRYPDGSAFELRQALVNHLGVAPEQITLGNGSNDVLDLIARVAVEPGTEVIMSEHCFVVYRLATVCAGGTIVEVPAVEYGTNLDGFLQAVTERTRLVCIANPNNPTGTWVGRAELTSFLDELPSHIWVVLDEAYFEFGEDPDYPDGVSLLDRHPNLIVTRTFSKVHGLAALRAGYGVSHPDFADLLNRARQPFNMNSLAIAAAAAALGDAEFVQTSRDINRAGLQQVGDALTARGISFIPSLGNFLTFDCGRPAGEVYEALLHKGVIVRPVAEYGLPTHLRVSIGLAEENARFLTALAEVSG